MFSAREPLATDSTTTPPRALATRSPAISERTRSPRSAGGSPGRTETVRVAPSRTTERLSGCPDDTVDVKVENAPRESTGLPATLVITSPAFSPADCAGEPPNTRATSAPCETRVPMRLASSGVSVAVTAPIHALCTCPYRSRSWTTLRARSTGMAKPIPCAFA